MRQTTMSQRPNVIRVHQATGEDRNVIVPDDAFVVAPRDRASYLLWYPRSRGPLGWMELSAETVLHMARHGMRGFGFAAA
jgi:hypothetical protein